MHLRSRAEMNKNLHMYCHDILDDDIVIIDVGSYDVNGTYRNDIPPKWKYKGVDIKEGPNVDIVMSDPKKIPIDDNFSDIVISGQCIEHCRTPWILVEEMSRILKKDGLCFITAPATWWEHRFPIDCFRYYPDGMRSLMEEAGLTVLDTYVSPLNGIARGQIQLKTDCWGIGRK
jgi:SAM-dependent methyltransferase